MAESQVLQLHEAQIKSRNKFSLFKISTEFMYVTRKSENHEAFYS